MFTPRESTSAWSKINRTKALRLISEGRMKTPGLDAIAGAKKLDNWNSVHDSQRSIHIPEDRADALRHNPKTSSFFKSLNSVNRYAILYRLQQAKKQETWAKRLDHFVTMLSKGDTIYPQ